MPCDARIFKARNIKTKYWIFIYYIYELNDLKNINTINILKLVNIYVSLFRRRQGLNVFVLIMKTDHFLWPDLGFTTSAVKFWRLNFNVWKSQDYSRPFLTQKYNDNLKNALAQGLDPDTMKIFFFIFTFKIPIVSSRWNFTVTCRLSGVISWNWNSGRCDEAIGWSKLIANSYL